MAVLGEENNCMAEGVSKTNSALGCGCVFGVCFWVGGGAGGGRNGVSNFYSIFFWVCCAPGARGTHVLDTKCSLGRY
jgi:hypothetical protein